MKRVHVAPDRWNFELEDGGYITPIGGNMINDQHPFYSGTLFDNFDADECERRLAIMEELGLNCLRQAIGVNRVFDPATGLKAAGLRNWDTFIELCRKHGIYLMPVGGYLGGNDWFDPQIMADSSRALDNDCRFWQAFAGHYAEHPAIWAWDLRNELLYSAREMDGTPRPAAGAKLLDGWPAWLEAKYSSLDTLNRLYGTRYERFADVPGMIDFVDKPFDLPAHDARCYMNYRGYLWCKAQCDVIRAVAPGQMIVSGNNGWLQPDMDLWLANGFANVMLADLFDFVTFHPYPAPQCLPNCHGDPLNGGEAMKFWLAACVGLARLDHYGKPVVVQEFGWYGGGESRFLNELPYRSEKEHADYTSALVQALIPHANGFINWPTFDMPKANDISNHGGIFTADGKPKELAKVYRELAGHLVGRRLSRAPATTLLTYSLMGLFTSRAYQDRFWEEVSQSVQAGEVPDFKFV